jgi:hypothetical protein
MGFHLLSWANLADVVEDLARACWAMFVGGTVLVVVEMR